MKTIANFELLKQFDRYEGDRRSDIKSFDKSFEYRGYKILRNAYIPNGADGRWEIPELNHIQIGGNKKGFLSVSKIQCVEAIDKWFNYNENLKNIVNDEIQIF